MSLSSSVAGQPTRSASFYSASSLNWGQYSQTDTGQIIGFNATYNSNSINPTGQASWFYDSATGVTTPLDFGSMPRAT